MSQSRMNSVLVMMGARFGCMLIGLAGIPILLSLLGRPLFAAWAVLLGCSFIFYTLELGIHPTIVKFLAEKRGEKRQQAFSVGEILGSGFVQLCFLYGIAFLLLLPLVNPLADWMKLPDTPWFSASNLLLFVYWAVAGSSIGKIGVNLLYSWERFGLVALATLLQTAVSSVSAWAAAWFWHRLDLVVLAYWGGQIIVLLCFSIAAKRLFPWQLSKLTIRVSMFRATLRHGVNLQFSELSNFIHYQFDKMLIAGLVGLPEVAHYEVASRAGLALRNLPASAMATMLPSATMKYAGGREIWSAYLETTRAMAYAVVLFLLVPLVVSPLFLFAWVGQIGYHGRWIFMLLALGLAANVIAMPVSIFIQAMGRTILETWVTICAMVINVVASLILVRYWGKEGVAAGTALALLISSTGYIMVFHRLCRQSLRATVMNLMAEFWPALGICLVWLGLAQLVEPLVIGSRWYMGPASVLLYGSCVFTLAVAYSRLGRVDLGVWRNMGLAALGFKADDQRG